MYGGDKGHGYQCKSCILAHEITYTKILEVYISSVQSYSVNILKNVPSCKVPVWPKNGNVLSIKISSWSRRNLRRLQYMAPVELAVIYGKNQQEFWCWGHCHNIFSKEKILISSLKRKPRVEKNGYVLSIKISSWSCRNLRRLQYTAPVELAVIYGENQQEFRCWGLSHFSTFGGKMAMSTTGILMGESKPRNVT